jgi:hypothetical protein
MDALIEKKNALVEKKNALVEKKNELRDRVDACVINDTSDHLKSWDEYRGILEIETQHLDIILEGLFKVLSFTITGTIALLGYQVANSVDLGSAIFWGLVVAGSAIFSAVMVICMRAKKVNEHREVMLKKRSLIKKIHERRQKRIDNEIQAFEKMFDEAEKMLDETEKMFNEAEGYQNGKEP